MAHEVATTSDSLESVIEQLEATNAELRAANEALRTLNDEATSLGNDLANVLSSIEIPILIVGRDLRLRKYTPAAARALGLVVADLGRPIKDVVRIVEIAPALARMVPEVLEHLRPAECMVQDVGGRWHHFVVRPYVTLDGRIDGTVITARDIDAETRAAARLAAAQKYSEDIVETVQEGLVVLGRDLRVRSTNTAFQRTVDLDPKQIDGRRLDELGRAELAAPALRTLLDELGDGATAEGVRVEHGDEGGGARVLRINARRIEGTDLTLVAIADVTEVERAEIRLQHMAFEAALNNERDRRRLALELHDGIGQDLALAKIKLAPVGSELSSDRGAAVRQAVDLIEKAMDDTRTLVFELSPPVLYDLGLKEALAWLADDFEQRHGIAIAVSDDSAEKQLDDAAKAIVFRAVRELVINVLKHAKARSAKIVLRRSGDQLEIDVEDEGIGFDPAAKTGRLGRGGFGLLSVREQIGHLGGTIKIRSAPQRGTAVNLHVPLRAGGASKGPPDSRGYGSMSAR